MQFAAAVLGFFAAVGQLIETHKRPPGNRGDSTRSGSTRERALPAVRHCFGDSQLLAAVGELLRMDSFVAVALIGY